VAVVEPGGGGAHCGSTVTRGGERGQRDEVATGAGQRGEGGADMGGVNHCPRSLHCRLAKFRDLTIEAKYSPVIGVIFRDLTIEAKYSPVIGVIFRDLTIEAKYSPVIG